MVERTEWKYSGQVTDSPASLVFIFLLCRGLALPLACVGSPVLLSAFELVSAFRFMVDAKVLWNAGRVLCPNASRTRLPLVAVLTVFDGISRRVA